MKGRAMQPDHVWTHVSDDQAEGRACVMCGRRTDEPGWAGVMVGRSPTGAPVYACSGAGPGIGGDPRGRLRPADPRPVLNCAEQATTVVPDSPEGLDL